MILTKGVEVIPKRDKVTIASNILGKWEDFSVETYQGKILKDAVERYKDVIKRGAVVSDKEIASLKQQLTEEQKVEDKNTDFWSVPKVESPVIAPVVEKKVTESITEPDKKTSENKRNDVTPKPLNAIPSKINEVIDNTPADFTGVVVVEAYVKNGRQVYLSGWQDCDDWMLSVVPIPTSVDKARKMIKKASKQIIESSEKATIRARFPKDMQFKIVPWKDPRDDQKSEEELVAIAKQMIEEHRASKKK